ncbi:unnamed protein product [Symbiodinium natans]|uniref:Uncharacterized protein n=1 Tax=Symbiodinium natans TaxID=878477 RepID=A0A812JAW1_9DINO|nr:unnamed protein product [Symbiodinium natans]
MEQSEPDDADCEVLKDQQMVRLADGGYVDDTAVAFIIKHLQDNGLGEDFRIVLFMNTTSEGVQMGSHTIPQAIARLFGESKRGSDLDNFPVVGSVSFETVSAHVFQKAAWDNVQEKWAIPEDSKLRLRHFVLQVETVKNLAFGIKAGDRGELFIFISEHSGASIVPVTDDDFQKYKEIYTKTRSMMKERHERVDSVLKALGTTAAAGSVKVKVAFSGGGWHSHTCHSAWFAAMLDAPWAPKLKEILWNVDVMASNSGGSWFLSMLAFSKAFCDALEVKTSRDQWAILSPDADATDANGFLEQTRRAFGGTLFEGNFWGLARLFRLAMSYRFDWPAAVKGLVYAPYDMKTELENASLSGACVDWVEAPDSKTLLFATSLMTEDVVLCQNGLLKDEQMYDAKVEGQKMFTPVFFARTPLKRSRPHFFSVGKEVALAYKSNTTVTSHPRGEIAVNQEDRRDGLRDSAAGVKVMDAATASSAAAALVASTKIFDILMQASFRGEEEATALLAAAGCAGCESPDAKRQRIL